MEQRTALWLTGFEHQLLTQVMNALVPGDGTSPGAGDAGGADYVDLLLSAFSFDPPRIFAGGPFSGRHGGEAGFGRWLELGPTDELAWRIRIEGTKGRPEREFNGPAPGWQERYRTGLAALVVADDETNFGDCGVDEQRRRLEQHPEFAELVFGHACESLYGDPIYGGNRDGAGWAAIGFDGDTQPRGWTDDEVTNPTSSPIPTPVVSRQRRSE